MSTDRTAIVTINHSQPTSPLRPIHGVNGSAVSGNFWLDLSEWYRHWQIPVTRLHDVPHDAHNTVDLHHLFPNPAADPDDPANYEFALTDDLIAHLAATGTTIYFRLGESIEHQPRLFFNAVERWEPAVLARVCGNIVRHYNCGWAAGHHWGIEYWEFWNEPHGPKNWNGTAEQFFDRYRAVATEVKRADPSVKLGLAGFARHCLTEESPWGSGLVRLAADGVAIDFVSWHAYLTSWDELVSGSHAVRDFLDTHGLAEAESHLGEWAYRPVHQDGLNIFSAYKAKRYDHVSRLTEEMSGPAALAFVFGALALLQDLPVDQAHYYWANTSVRWGLFEASGQLARRGLAFDVFARLLRDGGGRLVATSSVDGVTALAVESPDQQGISVIVAVLSDQVDSLHLELSDVPDGVLRDVTIHDALGRLGQVPPPVRTVGDRRMVTIPVGGPGLVVAEFAVAATPADQADVAVPSALAVSTAEPQPARVAAGDW